MTFGTPVFTSVSDLHGGVRRIDGTSVQTWAYLNGVLVHNTISQLMPAGSMGAVNHDYRCGSVGSGAAGTFDCSIQWALELQTDLVTIEYKIQLFYRTYNADGTFNDLVPIGNPDAYQSGNLP